ncbi:PLDc N-terminal domain-containing protein [Micrococcus sp. HMSC067E09]|uniref:PLDc N-terminal domain-containing protein n=1 Tax=Micrococcus sp. HMSC067E09 TaxID=1739367 RepID=UPI0008A30DF5|nr:PLDc N-terminal domain-containing protein [Micrococcus sp. HMSC067E09]
MPRFLIPAIIVIVALTLYCLFELLLTPKHQVRSMPKAVWFLVVLLLPLVGPLLWLILGRARTASAAHAEPRMSAPDDDEEFLRNLRVQRRQDQREADLERRAKQLNERERRLRERPGSEGRTGDGGADDHRDSGRTDGEDGAGRTDGEGRPDGEDGPEETGTDSPTAR